MNMNLHSIHGHNAHGMNSPTSSPTSNDFPSHSMSLSHSHHTHHAHVHHGHPHPLSRQHSFHQQQQHANGMSGRGSEKSSTSSTPLQSSPSPSMSTSISMDMDLYDDGSCDPPVSGRGAVKRQRMDDHLDGPGQAGPGSLNLSINANGHGSPSAPDSLGLISAVSSPGAGPGGGVNNLVVPKKGNMRARSDSAPLGYVSSGGGGLSGYSHTWGAAHGHGHGMGGGHGLGGANGHNPMNLNGHSIAGRPRSGSGMMPPRIAIPSIGGMGRPGGHSNAATSGPPTPMLSMSHVHAHQVGR